MNSKAPSHTHNQPTEASVWSITHGLKCKPSVSVIVDYEGTRQPIIPKEVEIPNDYTVTIRFSQPFSGVARLI